MTNKFEALYESIDLIRDNNLKEFAKYCIEKVPNYFFTVPASASGKYHPDYTMGDGGLVRHVKAAVKIAEDLLSLEQNHDLPHDEIIFALIFHDCIKKGIIEGEHTYANHPRLAADFVANCYASFKSDALIDGETIFFIANCIVSHMGQWDNNGKLPKPETDSEKFVHMCDYLASRKYLTCDLGE